MPYRVSDDNAARREAGAGDKTELLKLQVAARRRQRRIKIGMALVFGLVVGGAVLLLFLLGIALLFFGPPSDGPGRGCREYWRLPDGGTAVIDKCMPHAR